MQAAGTEQVVYEQPLTERIRAFLRLEHLFARARHQLASADPWSSQVVIEVFIDVLQIVARSDLKKELIKELERHTGTLNNLARNPRVDERRLEKVVTEVRDSLNTLHQSDGIVDMALHGDEFFCSVRQRSSIPAGTCDFDLPGFHHWLSGSESRRREDLTRWFSSFNVLRDSIELCLRLVRESAIATRETAHNGMFQETVDRGAPCQMIRVALAHDAPYYPEISAGRHRFTVRFMLPGSGPQRPSQTHDDIPFDLLRCVI